MNTFRPVSIAHLVFGLIFLGVATLWAIGAATDADAPDLAVLAPAILIGAGAVGLVGIVINARNARRRAAVADEASTPHDPEYADPGVLHHEEQS